MEKGKALWNSMGDNWQEGRQTLWRQHSDAINCLMLTRWLPKKPADRLLKTDLFDERSGEGLFSFLSSHTHDFVGIDISGKTLRVACSRHAALRGVAADVRRLPFKSGMFNLVVSNSTLDHFQSHKEIAASLEEVHRVLQPTGHLIITMDNPVNPLIALRNLIPLGILRRMKLTPYYVGATFGPRSLQKRLKQSGFRIMEMDALLHCPRVLAVAAAYFLERIGSRGLQNSFLRGLLRFEMLNRLPTRYLTGHYVAAQAIKDTQS